MAGVEGDVTCPGIAVKPFPETGRGAEGVLFMDKEVGSDGRTEAPGSLLWLSTKLPQGLRNTEKLHPEGLVPN